MFYDPGCFGRVVLGELPADVERRLAALPGEWLEFDAPSSAIVVRHIQPTAAPSLPTIVGELVRIVEAVPAARRAAIAGGDLFVHADGTHQLVRLRVEPGGAIHVRWAQPDYAAARRRPWERGTHDLWDPRVQRLNGALHFVAADPAAASRGIQQLAESFEGLYPVGDCRVTLHDDGGVRVHLADVNLDAELLVAEVRQQARARSLTGRIDVSSFVSEAPEHNVRLLLEDGAVWIQRPVLWNADDLRSPA